MTAMDDNPVVDGFEGPEKRLELEFRVNPEDPVGLRAFNKEQWQVLLDTVKCTIVSHTSNLVMESFVLSESSLFVYPYKIIIKTCGITTLLNCVPLMKEYAAKCGTEIIKSTYSRRNYNFPHKQPEPHSNFDLEIQLLKQYFPKGQALVMGPYLCGNHHFIYVWEGNRAQDTTNVPKITVEILMSELDEDVMSQFFRNEKFVDAKTTTETTGVSKLLQGMANDELMFDPCGYSVNGICEKESSYYTIHVTPESHCSFVSFETNSPQAVVNFDEMVEKVLKTFKPGRFHVIVLGLSHGEKIDSIGNYEEYTKVYSSQSELHFSALTMKAYVHPEAKLSRD